MQNVHFMSTRDDWATPPELFKKLDDEFHFTVDLCADDENHLVERYYTVENDGLKADISGEVTYCNPPYGRKVGDFVKKCAMGGVWLSCCFPQGLIRDGSMNIFTGRPRSGS